MAGRNLIDQELRNICEKYIESVSKIILSLLAFLMRSALYFQLN